MEDRSAWVAARAREIAAGLDFEVVPKTLFADDEFGRPVRVERPIEPESGLRAAEPQVIVSPEALESMSERELIYRMTYEMVSYQESVDGFVRRLLPYFLMAPLSFLAILFLAFKISLWWLLALPGVALIGWLSALLMLPVIDSELKKTHLRVIDLTGDPDSAIKVLEGQSRATTRVGRFLQGNQIRVVKELKREAESRGHRTGARALE